MCAHASVKKRRFGRAMLVSNRSLRDVSLRSRVVVQPPTRSVRIGCLLPNSFFRIPRLQELKQPANPMASGVTQANHQNDSNINTTISSSKYFCIWSHNGGYGEGGGGNELLTKADAQCSRVHAEFLRRRLRLLLTGASRKTHDKLPTNEICRTPSALGSGNKMAPEERQKTSTGLM